MIEGMPSATPRGTTANRAAPRERESPIGHPAAPVGNSKGVSPKPQPHNSKPRGTAGA